MTGDRRGQAGGHTQGGKGTETGKTHTVVRGCVGLRRGLQGEFRGGARRKKRGSDKVFILKHLKWEQWWPGVQPLRYGQGQHQPGCDAEDKDNCHHPHRGIYRVSGGGFGHAQSTPQRRRYNILRVSTLCGEGPPATRPKNLQITDGYRGPFMVHRGMLPGPRQHLLH